MSPIFYFIHYTKWPKQRRPGSLTWIQVRYFFEHVKIVLLGFFFYLLELIFGLLICIFSLLLSLLEFDFFCHFAFF